jgi:hypothetical protein
MYMRRVVPPLDPSKLPAPAASNGVSMNEMEQETPEFTHNEGDLAESAHKAKPPTSKRKKRSAKR